MKIQVNFQTQREIDGYPATGEQNAVADAFDQSQEPIRVQALAGTGKTTTLKLLAKYCNLGKAYYFAFNRSIRDEAKREFPKSVQCVTFHQLAFRNSRDFLNGRVLGELRFKDIRGILNRNLVKQCQGEYLANGLTISFIKKTLNRFYDSADHGVDTHHVPQYELRTALRRIMAVTEDDLEMARINREAKERSNYISQAAQSVWEAVQSGDTQVSHSAYLKHFQLQKEAIIADTILVDEAQDLNAVMLDIIETAQDAGARVIWVGDSNQQIYAWRGAVDALEKMEGQELSLQTSFRFGQEIADGANRVLNLLQSPYKLIGMGPEEQPYDQYAQTAYLFRTNIGLLDYLTKTPGMVGTETYVEGGVSGMIDLLDSLEGVKNGEPWKVKSSLLQGLNWESMLEEADENPDLKRVLRITDQGDQELIDHYRGMLNAIGNNSARSRNVLSTAHKSKGCQWKQVILGDDFPPHTDTDGAPKPVSSEELRLIYVAMTRGRQYIQIPQNLRTFLGLDTEHPHGVSPAADPQGS
jgi:superfamily I DNA/RNA helicase